MSLVITILMLCLLASLSPATIVVFILLLATTRAKVNAAAFLIGWSVSLAIVFGVSYEIGGTRTAQHGGGHTAVEVIEILLGMGLIFAAGRRWQHRNRPKTPSGGSRSAGDEAGVVAIVTVGRVQLVGTFPQGVVIDGQPHE